MLRGQEGEAEGAGGSQAEWGASMGLGGAGGVEAGGLSGSGGGWRVAGD